MRHRGLMAALGARPGGVLPLLACITLLGACGDSGGGGEKSSSSSSGGSGCSLAWCAPVGDPIAGATLYDGWEDLRVVPAPINVNGGWTDSVAVTADGLHLYFGYTQWDFSTFFISVNGGGGGPFDPSGPARTGMIGELFQIFRADLSTSGWSVNYHPVNSVDPAVVQASASVNEDQDLMVFSRFDPVTFDASIWFSQFDGSLWSEPASLPADNTSPNVKVNGGCPGGGDDNGFVIGDLLTSATLIWESRRVAADGTCGASDAKHHLYWSIYTQGTPGTWSAIEAVPGLNDFPGASDDTQVSFSADGASAYWTSQRTYQTAPTYGVFTADWDEDVGEYIDIRPVITPNYVQTVGQLHIQGELNVAEVPEGWVGYLMCGIVQSDTPNDIDLFICRMRKPR